jgi:diguanylate cyclase
VQRRQADTVLNESVRLEVAEMQIQVVEATELEQLKAEVKVRLESVVNAMDHHKQSEQVRQQILEQQLDTLTERMREMEVQSAAIEERMVEQRRLALLDTLTQLPNRQAYDERLLQEHQRWQRYQRPLSLAVCDLDNFKSINDNYGHLAGDKVLRIIAKTLRTRLRKTDFIARFGGEEFVVLMPETGAEEALHTLDTIRLAVANCPFHFREQPVTITVSAGIAAFIQGASAEVVFERADSALYRAKQSGRNRCVLDTTA